MKRARPFKPANDDDDGADVNDGGFDFAVCLPLPTFSMLLLLPAYAVRVLCYTEHNVQHSFGSWWIQPQTPDGELVHGALSSASRSTYNEMYLLYC